MTIATPKLPQRKIITIQNYPKIPIKSADEDERYNECALLCTKLKNKMKAAFIDILISIDREVVFLWN